MNQLNHPAPIQTQRFPLGFDVENSELMQTAHKNTTSNNAQGLQLLEAYLQVLGIPTTERLKICHEVVDKRLQTEGITDGTIESLSRFIKEAHQVILTESSQLEEGEGSEEWITASIEWRLRSWLMSHSMKPQYEHANQGEIPDIETLLLAPPIRRVSMPVASLKKCNQLERIVKFFADKMLLIGASTAQTFRRLLTNTLNG